MCNVIKRDAQGNYICEHGTIHTEDPRKPLARDIYWERRLKELGLWD